MQFIQTIKEFFNGLNLFRVILIGIIFLLAVSFMYKCNSDKGEIKRLEQNIEYFRDSLRTSYNKVGQLEYEKTVLAATNDNLKNLNEKLAAEVAKEKGRVIYLSEIIIVLKDSLTIQNGTNGSIDVQVNDDLTQSILFQSNRIHSEGNERKISGNVIVGFKDNDFLNYKIPINSGKDTATVKIPVIDENAVSITFDEDIITMTLVTGLKEGPNKNLEIFVRSDYPGFSATSIDGAIIDPYKSSLIKSYFPDKKWGVGVSFGPSVMVGFDGKFHPGVAVTLGINYSIWQWKFKKVK